MGENLLKKILKAHTKDEVKVGEIIWLDLDIITARDFGGPNVVKNFRKAYPDQKVVDNKRIFFTFDCNAPATTIKYAENQQICRNFAKDQGIKVFDVNRGIGTHVMIEEGLALPGRTMVGTDSHFNILGSVGVFGIGMGDIDIAFAFRYGKIWLEVPESVKITIKGNLKYPATSKDLALYLLKEFSTAKLLGKSIEFFGPVIEKLKLYERITLASMATEMGAVISLIPPDNSVVSYLEERAKKELPTIMPDNDAQYEEEIEIDIGEIEPMIACPYKPDNVVSVKEVEGRPIDSVFIGSCTNGRVEDYKMVAEIVKGKKVASSVMAKVVPATKEVFNQLLKDGTIDILNDAGMIISNPGCGGCAEGQIGMTGTGEVQLSTSNRNFKGKQGKGETYLVSPVIAAISALKGEISLP